MIKHALLTALVCTTLFHNIHAEDTVLDIKVLCVTLPGERIVLEGYEKKATPFAITGYKECYLFVKQPQPHTQQPTAQQIKKAAEEIVRVVNT